MTSDPKRGPSRPQREPSPQQPRGAASPAIVFAILLAVVAVVAGAALLLGSEPADQPAASPASPSAPPAAQSLTNEQAMERFKELDILRVRAYRDRNVELLSSVFSPDGPVHSVARSEIRSLERDNVRSATHFRTLDLAVISNQPGEIQLRQVRIMKPRFLDADGSDITTGPEAQRQVVRWVLRPENGSWLLHDSVIVRTRDLK